MRGVNVTQAGVSKSNGQLAAEEDEEPDDGGDSDDVSPTEVPRDCFMKNQADWTLGG